MKRFLIRFWLVTLAILASVAAFGQQIVVTVNGTQLQFPNTQPQMIQGRVLVPLRGIFEALGADVHWLAATQTVDANKERKHVQLQIGNPTAQVDGQGVHLDVPPQLLDNTTMVPLRFVSEALGADVNWVSAQNLVAITTHVPDEHFAPPPTRRRTPPPPTRRVVRVRTFPAGAVFPLRLDQPLGSAASPTGTSFTATLYTYGAPYYGGLPAGTKILGHVDYARNRTRTEPGILRLAFDSVQLPNGALIPIHGTMVSLSNSGIVHNANGILVVPSSQVHHDQAPVWVGGNGGVTVAVLPRTAFQTDITIKTAIGHWQQRRGKVETVTHDVNLNAGTELGVRLDTAFTLP